MRQRYLYLDNAATSLPKPPEVADAMARYMADIGASAGRGRYRLAQQGAEVLRECREQIAALVGVDDPSRVIFTLNGTDALHLAIAGVVRQRRRTHPKQPVHLVTTALDHNSVLRPLAALAEDGVECTIVEPDRELGATTPAAVAAAIREHTALVVVVHASNVTGAIQPALDIARVCRAAGVPMLLDAAQSAGHLPVNIVDIGVDMLAMPGHKGLLGPLGTGVLLLAPGAERFVATVREGGTGNWSESDRQPDELPTRYEAGSHNAVGIAGLSEGVRWLRGKGVEAIRLHEMDLIAVALGRLTAMSDLGIRVPGPPDSLRRVGVVSFTHDRLSPGAIAETLERDHGILVRAGVHCAPRAHRWLGTLDGPPARHGTVRMSFGPFVTLEDVHRACDAIAEMCGRSMRVHTAPRRAVSLPELRP